MLQAEGHGEGLHLFGVITMLTTGEYMKSHGKRGAFEEGLRDESDAYQLRGAAKILRFLEAITARTPERTPHFR